MPFRRYPVAVILLGLSVLCACGRPPADSASKSSEAQKLPFDRQPQSSGIGISPSQSLIPSATKLPEGTPIPVRLQSGLSSASSHAGDTFSATIDEPMVIDGQTVVERGTPATGRVLEAKPSTGSLGNSPGTSPGSSLEPGYLRIVLVSLSVGDRTVMIETSSIFAKGGSREERNPAGGTSSGTGRKDRDVVFGADRRLNFRLAQTVDLQR